ncbi:mucin 17, cell surface associated [Didymella heteroderae]|uniref:Mucin 17, cell surface associated n=1 Tax=Didymella heteroderae TaxID=1769908 RepID=A0A9P4WKJ5_9PLEO|nr:mucin 17, cell surface associated [Didymella heteroderae]
MAVSGVLRILTLAGTVSAFMNRDADAKAQPNTTAETAAATTVTTTWRPKVHGESSAYEWETSMAGSDSRVRVDATVSDFDLTTPTIIQSQESTASATPIDIGTIIQTLITTTSRAWAIPTVHYEDTASGWDEPTSTVHHESSATDFGGTTSEAAHWESSATGWEQTGHRDLSPQTSRYKTVEVTDDPWTKNLQPSRTAAPAQVTNVPSKTITDYPPPPVITHDGVAVRPVAVTRETTVTLPDGLVTTTGHVEFQVAIGSSTLSVGSPITIDNVVFDVTIDVAGSTVLHAGDLTTTLPKPTAGEVRTVADEKPERLSIATSVFSGTTKYILAGQTLAPGQPVTIGGTPISITTSGGQMVLFVGDKSTTLPAAGDMQALTEWATISSTSAGPRGTATNTQPASAVPTTRNSGSSAARRLDAALTYFLMSITMFAFTL